MSDHPTKQTTREQRLENALRALLRAIDNVPWRDAAGLRLGDAVPAVEDARGLLT
jgi:hypothetical protein